MTALAVAGVNPFANIKPTPRVKQALWLYKSGACKTKREASELAGLHPAYLSMLTAPNRGSEPVKRLADEIDTLLSDKAVDMSKVLQLTGRMAIGRMVKLMDSGNERIALDSAKELANKSPETAGMLKVQVDPFTIDGLDAKQIAAALIESARLPDNAEDIRLHGLVEVDITQGAVTPQLAPGPSQPGNTQA